MLDQARQVPGVTEVAHSITVNSSRTQDSTAATTKASSRRPPELLPASAEQDSKVSQEVDSDELAQEVVRRLQKQKDAGNLKTSGLTSMSRTELFGCRVPCPVPSSLIWCWTRPVMFLV